MPAMARPATIARTLYMRGDASVCVRPTYSATSASRMTAMTLTMSDRVERRRFGSAAGLYLASVVAVPQRLVNDYLVLVGTLARITQTEQQREALLAAATPAAVECQP